MQINARAKTLLSCLLPSHSVERVLQETLEKPVFILGKAVQGGCVHLLLKSRGELFQRSTPNGGETCVERACRSDLASVRSTETRAIRWIKPCTDLALAFTLVLQNQPSRCIVLASLLMFSIHLLGCLGTAARLRTTSGIRADERDAPAPVAATRLVRSLLAALKPLHRARASGLTSAL